ncbi:MAG: HAMP domain-containing protein [Coriobacteriales bacterium]|jgi:signal transduction histidine kinase|nr:HAMP domain-containing protein [Coriobacteriales bacterium]
MKSLRTQLSLSILLILLLTIALIGFFSNWFVNREFEKYLTELELTRSENIIADLGNQYDASTQSWNSDYVHAVGMQALYDGYILRLSDAEGDVVWDAESHDMTLCGQIMDDISARMESYGQAGVFSEWGSEISHNGQMVGFASVTSYGPYFLSENDFTFISALNTILVSIAIFASVLAVVVGYVLARRIARPVAETASLAQQIARGNYDVRFERTTNTRELDDLGGAINDLARALSEQEQLRKRMTADIAHELRTPLAAVGAHLEAMVEGLWELTPERLQGCHDEIQRLGALVAELEMLARIESEGLVLSKTRIDLQESAHTVAENLRAEASKKHQQLAVKGEPSLVVADKDRMQQILHNLLSNAIKYTPEGGSIQLAVMDEPDSGVVQVKDNGVGILADELPLVFERFYRAEQSRSRELGGAGIGLTIAQSLVVAHGGSLTVESHEGQGSCFTVRIAKG